MICLPCHQVSLFHINRMRPLALALWILAFGLGGQGHGRLLILKGSSSRRCHRQLAAEQEPAPRETGDALDPAESDTCKPVLPGTLFGIGPFKTDL